MYSAIIQVLEPNSGGTLYTDAASSIVFIEKREVKCTRGYHGKLRCLKSSFILLSINTKLKRCHVALPYCNRYVQFYSACQYQASLKNLQLSNQMLRRQKQQRHRICLTQRKADKWSLLHMAWDNTCRKKVLESLI